MDCRIVCLFVVAAVVAVSVGSSIERRELNHQHHHYYGDVHHYESGEDHSSSEEHSGEDHDERLYRFQIGEQFGAYEYIDDDGYLRGFHVDLVMALCGHAHKKCYYLLDTYKHCWSTDKGVEFPGVGLLDGWYDACIGLLPNPERLNSFNFSVPFTDNVHAALHYKPGVELENPADISGKKIGIVEGWVMSKNCLERQGALTGNHRGEYEPVFFDTHSDLVAATKNGEVDAALTVDVFDETTLGLDRPGPKFSCTLGGASVMANYGNDVIVWWNEAFETFRSSGQFSQLCNQANIKHAAHGKVDCHIGW